MTTVLLVDDNDIQRKLCKAILEDAGYAVATASSALDALRTAQAAKPDVIVSDVMMDDIDGFGLCRRLEEDSTLAGIPVVLVSAHYDDPDARALATSLGASALVLRTPDFSAEMRALSACTATRRPQRTISQSASYEAQMRTTALQMAKLLDRAKSAESQFRALFDGAQDLLSVVTPDGVIVDANIAWTTLTGLSRESMIGQHIRTFAAAGKADSNVEEFNRTRAAARKRIPAAPISCSDGRTIWVELSMSPISIEGFPALLGIGRDVTEEIVSAQQRAEAEERYRTLVERIPDVIWTARFDGTLAFLTPNAEALFGCPLAEIMATTFEERAQRVHPHDRDRVLTAYRAYLAHDTPFDVEYRKLRPDGSMVWVRNRAIGKYERDGVPYVEGMMTDVTDRKRLEDSLRQAQKMEAIGRLTGGIAHDFNNILAVILANSHMLVEDLADGDPRKSDAEEITAAADRAAALTRQLLAFSRHQVLELKVVDVSATIKGIERMLRRLIGEDIELAVRHSDMLGRVRVDVSQLEQVIMNLVVNARDAMPLGGRLSIETTNATLDREGAELVGSPPGSYVVISVTDNGCGMDRDTKQRIFDPFFTTKEVGKGTGLGLATCYGIVKQSGGHISVHSEVGHGSVFNIWLPSVDDAVDISRRPQTPVALDGHETVLLVEDDDHVRLAVARMLQRRGYKLLVACTPKEAIALAHAREAPIDLIISDMIMPGLSGPEVVEQVKARFTDARTLYMSGYTDHEALRMGVSPGAAFIQKPFSSELLARKVREALGHRT